MGWSGYSEHIRKACSYNIDIGCRNLHMCISVPKFSLDYANVKGIARIFSLLGLNLEPIAGLYSNINFVHKIHDCDARHSSNMWLVS